MSAAKRLDCILVIDVEATCWRGTPPPGQKSEIIEVGLCVLDVKTLDRLHNPSILVRPESSVVSEYCTSLTTLTQAEVDAGMPFREACRLLERQYLSRDRVWASYGDYDRLQFERQCRLQRVPYPFGSRHLNVKSLFALAHGLSREVGLDGALGRLGFALEGTHHRGRDDARNIARILAHLLALMRPDDAGRQAPTHPTP